MITQQQYRCTWLFYSISQLLSSKIIFLFCLLSTNSWSPTSLLGLTSRPNDYFQDSDDLFKTLFNSLKLLTVYNPINLYTMDRFNSLWDMCRTKLFLHMYGLLVEKLVFLDKSKSNFQLDK